MGCVSAPVGPSSPPRVLRSEVPMMPRAIDVDAVWVLHWDLDIEGTPLTMTDTPDAHTNPARKKKSDLLPRVVTAVVAVPLLFALLLAGPDWGFALLIGAAIFIAAWEAFSIIAGSSNRPVQVLGSLSAVAVGATLYLGTDPTYAQGLLGTKVLALVLAGTGLTAFVAHLATFKDIHKASTHIGATMIGLIYCGIMPATLAMLRRDAGDGGGVWVLMAMAIVWGSDTGAYFSGRALGGKIFGGRRLAPQVSPKKSIEGALGGLISSIVAVLVFKFVALPDLTLPQVFLLAVPANVLGQVGDLAESLLKRAHGVKDSGVIIYGHGGMLDRIDALIFAVPWIYGFHQFIFT